MHKNLINMYKQPFCHICHMLKNPFLKWLKIKIILTQKKDNLMLYILNLFSLLRYFLILTETCSLKVITFISITTKYFISKWRRTGRVTDRYRKSHYSFDYGINMCCVYACLLVHTRVLVFRFLSYRKKVFRFWKANYYIFIQFRTCIKYVLCQEVFTF